jgi:predicted transcriptional regulator
LQEADSRDVVTDLLQVLIENSKEKKALTSFEIKDLVEKNRKKHNLELKGVAESNIRRQLKKLKDLFLVESNNNKYNITEFMPLSHLFEKNIKNFYLQNIVERIEEYLKVLDEK